MCFSKNSIKILSQHISNSVVTSSCYILVSTTYISNNMCLVSFSSLLCTYRLFPLTITIGQAYTQATVLKSSNSQSLVPHQLMWKEFQPSHAHRRPFLTIEITSQCQILWVRSFWRSLWAKTTNKAEKTALFWHKIQIWIQTT